MCIGRYYYVKELIGVDSFIGTPASDNGSSSLLNTRLNLASPAGINCFLGDGTYTVSDCEAKILCGGHPDKECLEFNGDADQYTVYVLKVAYCLTDIPVETAYLEKYVEATGQWREMDTLLAGGYNGWVWVSWIIHPMHTTEDWRIRWGDCTKYWKHVACQPSWQCEIPLNGYESDGCGHRRLNAACNPCVPSWVCELPLNGYEDDGCGNRRPNAACNPCVPNWQCEQPLNGLENDGCGHNRFAWRCAPCDPFWQCELPLNGYENDGCGNRRPNAACNPCIPSWVCELPLNGYENDGCGNRRPNAECNALPGTGSVQFITVPTGADIYVDGTPQGAKTPATITNLSSGNYTYELVLSGYKDVTGTFTIEAGKTTIVNVDLIAGGIGAGTSLGIAATVLIIAGVVIATTGE